MDEQVVKLLQSIEKLLKTATATSNASNQGVFGSLRNAVSSRMAQARANRDDRNTERVYKTVNTTVKSTDKAMLALAESVGGLRKEVGKTTGSFASLQAQMAKFGAQLHMQTGVASNIPGITKNDGGVGTPASSTSKNSVFKNFVEKAGQTTSSLAALEGAVRHATDAVKKLTVDFFALARVGLGTVATLKQMSIDAALAGMSLAEYTRLVQENITFASRAGSMENFAKISSASDNMLASLGIFGAEARDLQASLANSNVMAGVAVSKLADAGAEQIKVFDRLRKTTNMTASEFANLVKSVSENEQTQRELVGLAPAEKQARMAELLSITTTGQRLGLTGKAAEDLAAALIAQRKETVQSRFEAAGRIMQLGAFTGQGAQAQRAAELVRRGRARSAAETEELRGLLQGIDSAAQGLYEAGNFAAQNVIDVLGPEGGQLGAAGDIMKASRVVENTATSGETFNRDFGQHVGDFGQAVGKAIALFRGFDQSVGASIAAAVGSALLFAFRGPVLAALKGAVGLGAGAAGAAGGAGALALSGLKGLASFAKPIAGIAGALIEMFTGEIASALNPSGGFFSRLGGIVTGFFTAIPNMIIDVIGYVFGEAAGTWLQNKFDGVVAMLNATFREFFGGIFQTLADVLGWLLPKDSGLVKSIRKWTDDTRTAADENWQAFEKLSSNSKSTLETLATDNKKAVDASVTSTKAATVTATAATSKFNNVQYGNMISAAQVAQDAALLASPQVQTPRPVGPAAVNTAESANSATPAPQVLQAPTNNPDAAVNVLNAILQVLNQSLQLEERQTSATEKLLTARSTGSFNDAEHTARRLNKGYA